MKKYLLRRIFIGFIGLIYIFFISPQPVWAAELQYSETTLKDLGIQFVDKGSFFDCQAGAVPASVDNVDYAGRPVLTDGQKQLLDQNKGIYERVAQEVGVPWQAIAVIHKNESGFGRTNPSNGQGIYQFRNGAGGPYPTGPVSEEEFIRQTRFMAEQLKNDYSQRTPLTQNRGLSPTSTPPDNVKDTFFSYNGRATAYANQAAAKGFSRDTQPFEGSPYVMNKTDIPRDPSVEPTKSDRTWGQVKTDGGSLSYPANNFHGAFVTYVSLGGTSDTGTGCSVTNGSMERVLQVARQELAAGASEANGEYLKYTGGLQVAWCAYFASWVFEEGGKPLEGGPIASADGIRAMGINKGYWHPVNEAGFTPRPGDIVVYKEGLDPYPSHVNIVEAYDDATKKITTIGGNENETIKRYQWDRYLPAITGYVRVP